MSTSMFDEYDIFKTMHPVKLQVMKELAENMQGKSMKDAAPLLMAAMTKLKNHNLSFSPEESKVMLEILTRNMSPQEKPKVVKSKSKKSVKNKDISNDNNTSNEYRQPGLKMSIKARLTLNNLRLVSFQFIFYRLLS